MRIFSFIQQKANELKARNELSHTRLMYEVMNELTDEDMQEMDTYLVDIAEKIELIMERDGR